MSEKYVPSKIIVSKQGGYFVAESFDDPHLAAQGHSLLEALARYAMMVEDHNRLTFLKEAGMLR